MAGRCLNIGKELSLSRGFAVGVMTVAQSSASIVKAVRRDEDTMNRTVMFFACISSESDVMSPDIFE